MIHSPTSLRKRKESKDTPVPDSPTQEFNKGKSVHISCKTSAASPSKDAETGFFYAFILVSVLTVLTRLWRIHDPAQVVFDEVHFGISTTISLLKLLGKFASYYLRREYFFDVHPPLAKMLIALAGWFLGYDGHFLFEEIGMDYIENNVPHIGFRIFCASFGILVIPFAFLIMKELGLSLPATLLGSMLLVLDNGLIAQSRLILLDSQLMFFCTLTIYCWIRFYKNRFEYFFIIRYLSQNMGMVRPFKRNWWTWLALTGVSLALTLGVKMVGLFAVATIGVSTLFDLWERLDIKRGLSIREFGRHFSARALCLIFLPLTLYLLFFYIHFSILIKSGPGDDFMSAAFQEGLVGNKILGSKTRIPYNSNITFKHASGAFLHSHTARYPLRYKDQRVSSQGQQVTGYPHQDANNNWALEFVDNQQYEEAPVRPLEEVETSRNVRYLRNRDIVRLKHVMTDSYLLTHDVASPLTSTNMELTTIPSDTAHTRFIETLWEIELSDEDADADLMIETKSYSVRIKSVEHKVAILCSKGLLPEWGFKQQEINGNKKMTEPGNNWVIDQVQHPRILNGTDVDEQDQVKVASKNLSFLQKFNELQSLMLIHNSRLTSSHPYSSHPISWPFVVRGISYWEEKEGYRQIYVLPNPFVWWFSIFSVFLFVALYVLDLMLLRRGINEFSLETRRWWLRSTGYVTLAWACHYFPFFLMGRQLFLHHYMPAFIFSTLVTACTFDFLLRISFIQPSKTETGSTSGWNDKRLGHKWLWVSTIGILTIMTISFFYFSPLTFGTGFKELETLEKRKWFKSWDIQYARK